MLCIGSARRFNEILSFGKWIFLASVLFFLASNGDRLILGGMVDANTLGAYVIAYTLFSALDQAINKIIVDVAFPALSEIIRLRPHDLTASYYKFHAIIALATYFCAGALITSGQAIVRLLYDERYQQAGWILPILAVALLTIPTRIATECLLALGAQKDFLRPSRDSNTRSFLRNASGILLTRIARGDLRYCAVLLLKRATDTHLREKIQDVRLQKGDDHPRRHPPWTGFWPTT